MTLNPSLKKIYIAERNPLSGDHLAAIKRYLIPGELVLRFQEGSRFKRRRKWVSTEVVFQRHCARSSGRVRLDLWGVFRGWSVESLWMRCIQKANFSTRHPERSGKKSTLSYIYLFIDSFWSSRIEKFIHLFLQSGIKSRSVIVVFLNT